MRASIFTNEQVAYISANYQNMGAATISSKLGLRRSQVKDKAKRMGLRLPIEFAKKLQSHAGTINLNRASKGRGNFVQKNFPGASLYSIAYLAILHRQPRIRKKDSLYAILKEICDIFNTDIEDVCGERQFHRLVVCRNIFCYIALKVSGKSMTDIGQFVGYRGHFMVVNAKKKIDGFLKINDPRFVPLWNKYLSKTTVYK